jgi:micrococcal nuclease
MNKYSPVKIFAALGLFLIGGSAYCAKVIGIADGDTLTVLEKNKPVKIRLAYIDAPEREQAFGNRARQSLSELCYGKEATYIVRDVDRYKRVVATVMCDGVEANRTQVERGMAWSYTRYSKDDALPILQKRAHEEKRGLWADAHPVPPWEWRKEKRSR